MLELTVLGYEHKETRRQTSLTLHEQKRKQVGLIDTQIYTEAQERQ